MKLSRSDISRIIGQAEYVEIGASRDFDLPSRHISKTVPPPSPSGGQLPGAAPIRGTLENMKKRAGAKHFSRSLAERLVMVPGSPLNYSYQTTLFCSAAIEQKGDKFTAKYCNGRWCSVCNRIRIAKCMNGYLPELEKFEDPRFLTLTIPNMPGLFLQGAITQMIKVWRLIYRKLKKAGYVVKAVRKLECTYNFVKDNYHPHFHFIVEGRAVAHFILREWLKHWPEAVRRAQDIQKATKGEKGTIKELFKYFTKFITQKNKKKGVEKSRIYIEALDTIFCAMVGKQVFRGVGIKKVSEVVENLQAVEADADFIPVVESLDGRVYGYADTYEGMKEEREREYAQFKIDNAVICWLWVQAMGDWQNVEVKTRIDFDTGELTEYRVIRWLTGHVPKKNVIGLFKHAVFDNKGNPFVGVIPANCPYNFWSN